MPNSVATVLTVYGIETNKNPYWVPRNYLSCNSTYRLRSLRDSLNSTDILKRCNSTYRLRYWNKKNTRNVVGYSSVATVLTVYGIETNIPVFFYGRIYICCNSTYRLRYWNFICQISHIFTRRKLQQYLPFTVLKRVCL